MEGSPRFKLSGEELRCYGELLALLVIGFLIAGAFDAFTGADMTTGLVLACLTHLSTALQGGDPTVNGAALSTVASAIVGYLLTYVRDTRKRSGGSVGGPDSKAPNPTAGLPGTPAGGGDVWSQ